MLNQVGHTHSRLNSLFLCIYFTLLYLTNATCSFRNMELRYILEDKNDGEKRQLLVVATREELEDKIREKCNLPPNCVISIEYYDKDFDLFVLCRPQDLPDKARIRVTMGLPVVDLDTVSVDFSSAETSSTTTLLLTEESTTTVAAIAESRCIVVFSFCNCGSIDSGYFSKTC